MTSCVLRRNVRKRGSIFLGGGYDLHRNYGMVVILMSFLCNYGNLTLKLHQEKRSYSDERWLFIVRFKVGSEPGMTVALEASKKVSKSIMGMIRWKAIKTRSYNCY